MRPLSFRYCFKALAECDFILEVLWLKSHLALNPKDVWKIKLFAHETDSSINLNYESLITVDYKYKEILLFWM